VPPCHRIDGMTWSPIAWSYWLVIHSRRSDGRKPIQLDIAGARVEAVGVGHRVRPRNDPECGSVHQRRERRSGPGSGRRHGGDGCGDGHVDLRDSGRCDPHGAGQRRIRFSQVRPPTYHPSLPASGQSPGGRSGRIRHRHQHQRGTPLAPGGPEAPNPGIWARPPSCGR
jgi:hypothetical protein